MLPLFISGWKLMIAGTLCSVGVGLLVRRNVARRENVLALAYVEENQRFKLFVTISIGHRSTVTQPSN
ncbi:hypothetical protein VNO78_26576 [Psophocarpus tetragonolobus]|uniref:Uncharacterized protein n=1 Tax=Psophocarpus tetragonolobus TaxID=3891 RepID=A0AAN9X8P5_PSOTE